MSCCHSVLALSASARRRNAARLSSSAASAPAASLCVIFTSPISPRPMATSRCQSVLPGSSARQSAADGEAFLVSGKRAGHVPGAEPEAAQPLECDGDVALPLGIAGILREQPPRDGQLLLVGGERAGGVAGIALQVADLAEADLDRALQLVIRAGSPWRDSRRMPRPPSKAANAPDESSRHRAWCRRSGRDRRSHPLARAFVLVGLGALAVEARSPR